jgi:archaeal flagellin FlaB
LSWKKYPIKRRGMTGLETAIILVAFVITAAAFSFVVLNMGFLTAQKSQTVISAGMQEATSSLQADGDLTGEFNVSTGEMTMCTFYVRLSQGKQPIDTAGDKLIVTYSNPREYGVIKDGIKDGATFSEIVGDGDGLVEYGERWKVEVNFTAVAALADFTDDAFSESYDTFRLELRPSQGAVLAVERAIPAVNTAIMILE